MDAVLITLCLARGKGSTGDSRYHQSPYFLLTLPFPLLTPGSASLFTSSSFSVFSGPGTFCVPAPSLSP